MYANVESQTAREELVTYCRRMVADGLAASAAGNLSARAGEFVAITPSGISYTEIATADICLVTPDGAEVDVPETPSSELPMHLAVYRATNAGAVVHTHSAEVIALSTVAAEARRRRYGERRPR